MNTPETDKRVWSDHSEGILYQVVEASFARRLEIQRDEARKHLRDANRGAEINAHINQKYAQQIIDARDENAKFRDIAERAIDLAVAYYDGPCERDAAKLRAELDQLKEGGK
jgi:hypothetical protein